jgi:hypothetical protein
VEVAQRGVVVLDVKQEPRMLAELRIGAAKMKQLKRSDAVGIKPGRDDRRLRGSHVIRRIVKQDAVSRLREVEEENEQSDNKGPQEA